MCLSAAFSVGISAKPMWLRLGLFILTHTVGGGLDETFDLVQKKTKRNRKKLGLQIKNRRIFSKHAINTQI